MNICSYEDYKRADEDLNRAYGGLTEKLDDKAKARVRAAEQAWMRFRDAECLSRLGERKDGGTIYPLLLNTCAAILTRERAKQLREQTDCPEGQMDCPH